MLERYEMASRQAENCRDMIFRGFTVCKNHDGLSVSKGSLRGVLIISIFAIAVVLAISKNASGTEAAVSSLNFKNPDAVRRVLSGKETTANAAWWGFDEVDSTEAIQAAINSGATKVIIPYVGREWIVRPIKLANNQEVFFEPGVVVMAKKGEFKDKTDCLFSGNGLNKVTLKGYGATLRMRKSDYNSSKYTKSEHRHTLIMLGSSDIIILGLRLEKSGGDGIYIPCKNVMIKDCICDDNYRQGISVTSADTVIIENCMLKNTKGTLPAAGIDLEVHDSKDVLANIVVSNCISENNSGSGFIASISRLSEKSRDVSILFVNCYARNCAAPGLRVRANSESGPGGLIEFKNCTSENIAYSGIYAIWKLTSSMKLRFSDCKLQNVARKSKESPIGLELTSKDTISQTAGVELINCYVYDKKKRPFLKIIDTKSGKGICDVKGNITVFNPYGATIDTGAYRKEVPLKVRAFTTK
ncbi:MAG: right-handed parallel beta-helix repeat-containing protein [Planctomycetota bacterium]|jgi:polygalacturonase